MGWLKYVPSERPPDQATGLLQRMVMFHGPGLVLNQVPKQDSLCRNKLMTADRRVVTKGPIYVIKGADIGVVDANA